MIIDFKFDYEADVVLHGGRVPKKFFIEGQMSVDVKSVSRDDIDYIAIKANKRYLQDYVAYDGNLYTPVKKNNVRYPGNEPVEGDINQYEHLDEFLISNLPDCFKREKKLKRVCGLKLDDIHHFDDIYYLDDLYGKRQRIHPDKKIKFYHSDNRTFIENKIKNILDKFIFIDGELYRKSIGPVFKVDLDVSVIREPHPNSMKYFDSYKKKLYTHNDLGYSMTHIIEPTQENRIFNSVGIVPPCLFDFLQGYGDCSLNLTIDMLNFYIYDDKKINTSSSGIDNFHVFDMEFLIKQNSCYYGEILFNQIMDFQKLIIENTPENFEKYFLTLKEKYPFGDELYFLIKNCQNDSSIENLDELVNFVEKNYKSIKSKPSIYKDNSDIGKNNINYPSDKDFFAPLLDICIFLNNYKNMQNLSPDTYLSTKIGDKITTFQNKQEMIKKI